MPKKIIIFPFGGNSREALNCLLDINNVKKKWNIIGFLDDDRSQWGKSCCGIEVKGGREIIQKYPDTQILALPGSPSSYSRRKDLIKSLKIEPSRFATIIHPTAILSCDSVIGYNTVLMPNVVVSCGVKIGNHCIILPNTVIAHDSVIGDYCCVGSNVTVSGYVTIGPECYIGSGTKIRDNIRIGKKTLVGLGSNVVCDIQESVVVAGNPARVIRKAM